MIAEYKRYLKKSYILRQRAELILSEMPNSTNWNHYYLSHSLLSELWQTWCSFCRDIIICSCAGTSTRTGSIVPARLAANGWKRVAYEAIAAKRGQAIKPNGQVNKMYQEPTWGDQDMLLRAIPMLSPANASQLLTGFGLPLYGPKHIQIIRNSCAHINPETVTDVRRLIPLYTGRQFSHPLDILWWHENVSQSVSIFLWLTELEIVAEQVTR